MDAMLFTYVAIVLMGGVAAQWVGWRLRVPPIILLLALGLAVGPGLGVLRPSEDLGHGLEVIVGLSVAVVVFEGGLKLRLADLRRARSGVARLILVGLPLTWLFGALAARFIVGLPWGVAVLFGAILVVTGPTVMLPLLRGARLKRRPAALLKWEAVVNDPIGALLTVVTLEYLLLIAPQYYEDVEALRLGLRVLAALLASAALGVAAAWLVREAFHRDRAPEVLRTPLLLAGAIGLYVTGNLMQKEAGLVAATVFGLALANMGITGLAPLSRSKEALSTLLVSALFILLAADLERADLAALSGAAAVLVGVVLVAVRPLAVLLATVGGDLSWRERLLTAWIGPRGIVAAALAGIAGGRLEDAGWEGAGLLQPLVFAVIAATVVLHGLTLAPVARRLGLRTTERPGMLIVGASPFTIQFARMLKDQGVPVILADRSWGALRPARDHGIPGLVVEILSERVEAALENGQADYVLAATDDDAYNALVCARFAPELGRERVHQLAMSRWDTSQERAPAPDWRGKILSGGDLDHRTANELLAEGWRFEARRPAHVDGTMGEQAEEPGEKPLVVVKADGRVIFNTPERKARARAEDCMIFFVPDSDATPSARKAAAAG